MSKGNFEAAWTVNDLEGQHWPSAHQCWSGEPLTSVAVELQARHGLGDFVQMMRFVPALNELGCSVSINVRPEIRTLAAHFSGTFTLGPGRDPRRKHETLEMMELPYALRLQPDELPVSTSYLQLPSHLTADKRLQMKTGSSLPKVGIVWSGSSWDPERWISFDRLAPLLDMSCCEWWGMQESAVTSSKRHPRLRTLASHGDGSLVGLASAMHGLDLLITVDTLAAHIAGALGIEVWLLLKKHADWRWMQNRADSPWYPTMRLFRQKDPGDWHGVISTVQRELCARYENPEVWI